MPPVKSRAGCRGAVDADLPAALYISRLWPSTTVATAWRDRTAQQFLVRPRPRSTGCQRADLFHDRRIDGRSRLAPLAADVGQYRGNLLVAQRRSHGGHQSDRALFAAEENPRRYFRRRQRHGRFDEGRRKLVLTASIRLMAGLADVLVDLPAGVEALLFRGRQRRDRRGRARLARPRHACQQRAARALRDPRRARPTPRAPPARD